MLLEGLKLTILGMGFVFGFILLLSYTIRLTYFFVKKRTLREKELLTIKK